MSVSIPGARVAFLATPIQGRNVSFVLSGQHCQSSVITAAEQDPRYPGFWFVDTQSGSRYHGPVQPDHTTAIPVQRTVMATPPLNFVNQANDVMRQTMSPAGRVNAGAYPPGLNWGAFLLTPFWGAAHNVWIALLGLLPGAGWVVAIIMLIKGNELAWHNRQFRDYRQFADVQRAWMAWGLIVDFCGVLFWLAFFFVPMIASAIITWRMIAPH